MNSAKQQPAQVNVTTWHRTLPTLLLRMEALLLLIVSLYLYFWLGGSWLLLLVLLLVPDLSMLGYAAGPHVGAVTYNLFHSYPLPATLGLIGLLSSSPLAILLALIWLAHIELDRVLGYGLKFPTSFHHTHLGDLGREKG
jgi:hypothetical protein